MKPLTERNRAGMALNRRSRRTLEATRRLRLGFSFPRRLATGGPRTKRPGRHPRTRNVIEGAGKPMDAAAGSTARLEHPAAPRLSLLVLPFANIGGDASQDYFVDDGVTGSLHLRPETAIISIHQRQPFAPFPD